MPPFEHETIDECLEWLRNRSKEVVDSMYEHSKTNAVCDETKESTYHWFAHSIQCPVENNFRIDLKIRYRKCLDPDGEIDEYQYDMGLYIDDVLQRSGGSYEYPPHHTPFRNSAYNMIDDFFRPGVGPFPSSSSSPSPSPSSNLLGSESAVWNPTKDGFWNASNIPLWIYVGIVAILSGGAGFAFLLLLRNKEEDPFF